VVLENGARARSTEVGDTFEVSGTLVWLPLRGQGLLDVHEEASLGEPTGSLSANYRWAWAKVVFILPIPDLACFDAVSEVGRSHCSDITGDGSTSVTLDDFTWVNTMIGNVKNAFSGTYHAINAKDLPRYLAEFC
jgi:hypothetical protein